MCLPCAYLWAWALSCVGFSLIEEINQTTTKSNLELFTTRVIWHLPRKGLLYVQTAYFCDYIKRILYTQNVSVKSIFMAYSYHGKSLSPPILIFMIISKEIITTIWFLPTMLASVLYCCFVFNEIYNCEEIHIMIMRMHKHKSSNSIIRKGKCINVSY